MHNNEDRRRLALKRKAPITTRTSHTGHGPRLSVVEDAYGPSCRSLAPLAIPSEAYLSASLRPQGTTASFAHPRPESTGPTRFLTKVSHELHMTGSGLQCFLQVGEAKAVCLVSYAFWQFARKIDPLVRLELVLPIERVGYAFWAAWIAKYAASAVS